MKPLQSFLRQFHFTRAERHGAAALLLLAGAVFLAPELYRKLYRAPETDFSGIAEQPGVAPGEETALPSAGSSALFAFDPNTAPAEQLVQLGLSEKVARTIVKYRSRGGRFRSPEDLQKIYVLSEEDYERLRPFVRIRAAAANKNTWDARRPGPPAAEVFPFDPNTATEQELLRLGLGQAQVGRLLRYREKGGYFFEKQDFRKLYGLPEATFARLEPYIDIRREAAAVRPAAYSGGASAGRLQKNIDINAATPEDWQQLPGIGAARAQKIVRFRDKLGGFSGVEQVGETYGLPDSVFQVIRAFLHLEAPVFRKINLNAATPDEIDAHPYFSFKQARLIVAYREQHGPFGQVEDLGNIQAFADKVWLERVMPYLTVQ